MRWGGPCMHDPYQEHHGVSTLRHPGITQALREAKLDDG
jgi:hypothetical protein